MDIDVPDPATNNVIEIDPHQGQQVLCHGYTVLVTNADGSITSGRQGLFDFDTRVLSHYRLLIDDQPLLLDSAGSLDSAHWTARLTLPRSGGSELGPQLPQDVLELSVRRQVGNGMAEWIELFNHSGVAIKFILMIECDADFADLLQLDAESPGTQKRTWDAGRHALTFELVARREEKDLHRAMRARVLQSASAVSVTPSGLKFDIALPSKGSWAAGLAYETFVEGGWRSPVDGGSGPSAVLRHRRAVADAWQEGRAHVESDPPLFGFVVERAANDLLALRNWEYDAGPHAWIPNAGLPSYTGLFGRDVLTAGWQAMLISPEMSFGALARLADTQAETASAWQDAEPGKMIHEMRSGPRSVLDIRSRRAYYGTQTSSSFFVVSLSELWHWTGDDALLRRYRDAALRTFDWADRYGDRDGDGLLEYETRSADGLRNHGWKDSNEAIRHEDGSLAPTPIATYEEQAFHWLARQRMAEMLLVLGEEDLSRTFLERARQLREQCHERFWMPDLGFYAMAIDGAKRLVRSIGSNAGHALAAGLIPVAHAERVAQRLMSPDMFSGWGIRTLSSDHPSYNPFAYHLGAVWPVETATTALGCKRYGLDRYAERLVTGLFGAASCFRYARLPEALGGHSRAETPIPTVYPGSCSPQAWSASATIQAAQTLLGLYPFAPAHLLAIVRPTLPRWLRRVTIRNLRIGSARASLQFDRDGDRTRHQVLDKTGTLHVLEAPPPQDVDRRDGDWRDRLAHWLLEHAPGRTAAAIRIALGL